MSGFEQKRRALRPLLWISGAILLGAGFVAVRGHSGGHRQVTELERATAAATTLRQSMPSPAAFEIAQVLAMRAGAICYVFRAPGGRQDGIPIETAFLLSGTLWREKAPGFIATWNHSCIGESRNITADVTGALGLLTLH